jgi:hypothetical protein
MKSIKKEIKKQASRMTDLRKTIDRLEQIKINLYE